MSDLLFRSFSICNEVKGAAKAVVEIVAVNIWPLIFKVKKKLVTEISNKPNENLTNITDVFMLCCSQLKTCVFQLFEIFKLENMNKIVLKESRQCYLERLSWCINRLEMINSCLDSVTDTGSNQSIQDTSQIFSSILTTPIYFVHWVDHAFELLTSLCNIIYRTDYKNSEASFDDWKNELCECIKDLHVAIDELLLSAMTLSKYCLPADQHIVTARCQVVLREAKALLLELVEGDLNSGCKVTKECLKLPIKPSNVNLLIVLLKDVLYVLETNTNTSLLTLVVHCFSNIILPIDILKAHLKNGNTNLCPCKGIGKDVIEDCIFIKNFDLYNERLSQIGSFAVSCSADRNRILCLRNGLASLEALDPHLVPALMLSPDSHHSKILQKSWKEEVQVIRDSVFLIIDPAAFSEKCKQMIHNSLINIIQNNIYDSEAVCGVINIGGILHEFFTVYNVSEPEAIAQRDKLLPILKDLNKVLIENKVVYNMLRTSDSNHLFNVEEPKNKTTVTLEQLIKRLKLLYTLVKRINNLFHAEENDDQIFVNDNNYNNDAMSKMNLTHNIQKSLNTYVKGNGRKSTNNTNISRSMFVRSAFTGSGMRSQVLSKLSKQIKEKRDQELTFSIQIDELFDHTDGSMNSNKNTTSLVSGIQFCNIKEQSILYNFSSKNGKSSLRKAVLSRNHIKPFEVEIQNETVSNQTYEESASTDVMNELQITEILDQFADITTGLSPSNHTICNGTITLKTAQDNSHKHNNTSNNILTLSINESDNAVAKNIWNIPISTEPDLCLDNTANTTLSGSSQPSNISTLERINDLDLLEDRLNDLKMLHETNL